MHIPTTNTCLKNFRRYLGNTKTSTLVVIAALAMTPTPAFAGPPFITDDPQPTPYGHYEIYAFATGTTTKTGSDGAAGLDLNYGAMEGLQLTMVLPMEYDRPDDGSDATGFGDIELAVKYKFLKQEDCGVDVAFFPRLFVPTASNPDLGSDHPSLFLPIFMQKDWGDWSLFGGGGYTFNDDGDSRNFGQMGVVLTRHITSKLQLGFEIYHQTPDEKGAKATTGIDLGAIYDLNENFHLMASAGPGIRNADETNRATWYTGLLFTF
ncbi:MAG: transporter [Luteolibacter sp.]